jgi:hypothetical protein
MAEDIKQNIMVTLTGILEEESKDSFVSSGHH